MIINLWILSLILLTAGCNSSKNTITDVNSETQSETMAQDKNITDGYSKGTIVQMRNSSCPFIIVKEDDQVKLDPINFDTEKFMAFRKAGDTVYFKFRMLRRMNRCPEAHPIELTAIKKME